MEGISSPFFNFFAYVQKYDFNFRKKKDKETLAADASDITDRLLSISRTLSDATQRSADTLETLGK